jgi:hypothetical protein
MRTKHQYTFKQKADIFFFLVVFAAHFAMVFSVIKQMQQPVFKAGLKQSSEIMTRNVR